jgi:hypothetical protein
VQLQPGHLPVALGLPQRVAQPPLGLARTQREQQQRRVHDPVVHDPAHEVDRGRVRPVQVVERQHDRVLGRQRLEQRVQGAQDVMALRRPLVHLRRGGPGQAEEGQHARERGEAALVQFEALEVRGADRAGDRLAEDRQREVLLVLRRPAGERREPAPGAALERLPDQ